LTRTIAVLVAIAALVSGCAPDPPSSVVGLRVVGCRPHPEVGSGMFVEVDGVDSPLVLTSAHVVAGAREITVTRGDASRTGTVVAFDPDMDLAYVAVDGLGAPRPWTVASSAIDGGERATVYVMRDGRVVALPSEVRRRVRIRTEDIYVEGETLRPGYELTADIEQGDSGGALVLDGKVVGVVWANSRRGDDRAYAIDPLHAGDLVREQLSAGSLTGVDLTRCT
jgi:S1-C subfamily serine protease